MPGDSTNCIQMGCAGETEGDANGEDDGYDEDKEQWGKRTMMGSERNRVCVNK